MFKHQDLQTNMGNFHPLEAVGLGSKPRLQEVESLNYIINPSSPHDALKHHFTSL